MLFCAQTSSRAVGEVALPRAAEGPGRYCMLLCRCKYDPLCRAFAASRSDQPSRHNLLLLQRKEVAVVQLQPTSQC